MESLSNCNLLLNIIEYLSINDTYKLILLNKSIYNNIDKNELKCILNINIKKMIIYKSIKKYINILKYIPDNTNDTVIQVLNSKSLALFYYKHYPKDYISNFYNMDIDDNLSPKSEIIKQCKNKYNLKKTNIPSRYDLYCLVKNMHINDTYYVGW
jgi:hypothetical protein